MKRETIIINEDLKLTFIKTEKSKFPNYSHSRDFRPGGQLSGHLQPDLHNLQGVREHHLDIEEGGGDHGV